ncbi:MULTISPECIES: LLM class flavin-dependent oxidoreductase [Protofrankia]|uniref:Monooxygenase n=1 Tax=Protofrankia coriariae TaxID=1562887 RepID=A0ABR5F1R0_9ACTN|nr:MULTISPECIES: LLM class flavin-dependent oxidoreductase [Protofrankia]KLL10618.1 monooxygenase [Protofrankia coriariae]ONH35112.1 flavin-dependent oxidoreductase [Protofrankia sp. BMG5.30]
MARRRLRFGAFVPPHHVPVKQNPTYSLQRDVEIVQLMDNMGFEEAWFGEHHSCGVEPIGDPLMFIAHVANLTKTIRLGTGVLSLPYHNPLWVADRMVLLDHLTRGRAMLGLGPGALSTDANMIGIEASEQRDALEQDTAVLMHLLTEDEPLTIETPRYKLVEARLQLDTYTNPLFEVATAAIVSPSGPRLAGKHDLGMISIGATSAGGFDAVGHHWGTLTERAAEFGHTPDRSRWRLVAPFHIAATRDQALRDVEHGIDAWCDYLQHTASTPQMKVEGETTKERIEWVVESGTGVIGTYEDAINQIERLWEQSKGGFGAMLLFDHNWAPWSAKKEHYHLFANHVLPAFQGTTRRLERNEAWTRSVREAKAAENWKAIEAFSQKHADEVAAKEAAR